LRDGVSAPLAALYLEQIQQDEVELGAMARDRKITDDSVDPAFLRLRAKHYRELAKATDAHLASVYSGLGKMCDGQALMREDDVHSDATPLTSPSGRNIEQTSRLTKINGSHVAVS
jgi:hypothetical protein